MNAIGRLTIFLLALVLLGPDLALAAPDGGRVRARLGGVPVPFVANNGQVDPRVAYYAPTFAGTVFVTRQGQLVYTLPAPAQRRSSGAGWSLTETLAGGRVTPEGRDRSATGVSYFLGNDPARWRPGVPGYDRLGLGEVWPGVTVDLRAHGCNVEKVFTVAPGASPGAIRIRVGGADALSVDGSGALVAATGLGAVTFTRPVAYQERDGMRHPVSVAYRLGGREYGFSVGAYDRGAPLVIDPLLQATYLGGSITDWVQAIAIHPITGFVYAAGFTNSPDFPGVAGGAQPVKGDGFVGSAFVARLTSDLTTLAQATFLGGSTYGCIAPRQCLTGDSASALAIHPLSGDVYVAGRTASSTFPGTTGGAQPNPGGGAADGFVVRLTESLTGIVQATFLSGSSSAAVAAVAIHPLNGDVYVTGAASSDDLLGAAGGAQSSRAGASDAFVTRLTPTLTAVVQATYLGGSTYDQGQALAIHPSTGDVYVTGDTYSTDFVQTAGGAQPASAGTINGFVARLTSSLTAIVQATYLGGSALDLPRAIAIHPFTSDVYVAGSTSSPDFPGVGGGAQTERGSVFNAGFIARLNGGLTALIQATYLGSPTLSYNDIDALAIEPTTGDVLVAGLTAIAGGFPISDFPGAAGGIQPTKPATSFDVFVSRLTRGLTTIVQSTYLGGSGASFSLQPPSMAIHPTTGDVYVAGFTASTDFPGTAGGAQPSADTSGGFIARLTSDLLMGADLTLTKAHTGSFFRGQSGAAYTLVISNVGLVPTIGTVHVTETLPAGLTATALLGAGWSCTRAPLTCTRADVLLAGASYPPISLTVDVVPDAPDLVTNVAAVSGGGDSTTANNTASDPTAVTSFGDVASSHPLLAWIEALAKAGITSGCAASPPLYCPDTGVTRAQMAVFLVRGIHGAGFDPPAATGTVFADVPQSHPLAAFIEQLARDGITGGCSASPPLYCPDAPTQRGPMAVFLLRAMHGAAFDPPAATGTMFTDVPQSHPFAAWIEQLAREGITAGCGPTTYCPDATVTRAQMAVFLVRAFNLPT